MILQLIPRIIEIAFFAIVISYYVLLFLPKKKPNRAPKGKITVLIPARNEEIFIEETITSVINSKGNKEIIVIDDASTDKTYQIAKKFPITLLRNNQHKGKALCLNLGLEKAKGKFIAVVDADSIIEKDALVNALKYFDKDVACVTSIVRVKNRKKLLGMWLHIEQLYNSLLRTFFSKINANIITPGPLSIYRKKDLLDVGGFDKKGFSEDVDIAIRLLRKGKRIEVSEESIAETNMPISIKGFFKQRIRFVKGWIHIFKKHMNFSSAIIDLYSLPLALFWYLQATIMSIFIISQLVEGYITYFYSQGIIFNGYVVSFFFGWFSIFGIINWTYSVLSGSVPLTLYTMINLSASLLSYPLYIYSIIKYDKRIRLYHIVPLLFMFPYWFIIMLIYLVNSGEWISGLKLNRWEKVN